jgi:hypothetical protein
LESKLKCVIKSKTVSTVAEITSPGSVQHIWMIPTGNWRYSILRFYWDDETLIGGSTQEIFWNGLGVNMFPAITGSLRNQVVP